LANAIGAMVYKRKDTDVAWDVYSGDKK